MDNALFLQMRWVAVVVSTHEYSFYLHLRLDLLRLNKRRYCCCCHFDSVSCCSIVWLKRNRNKKRKKKMFQMISGFPDNQDKINSHINFNCEMFFCCCCCTRWKLKHFVVTAPAFSFSVLGCCGCIKLK